MACRRSAVRSRWAPPLKKGPRKRAFLVAGGIVGPRAALGWGAADPPPLGEGDHAKHGGGAREVFLSFIRNAAPPVPLPPPRLSPPPCRGGMSAFGRKPASRHTPAALLCPFFLFVHTRPVDDLTTTTPQIHAHT